MSTMTGTVSPASAGAREQAREGTGRFGHQLRQPVDIDLGATTASALDAYGNVCEVTPGVIDERAEHLYTQGQCLALAVATARRTGQDLVVKWGYTCQYQPGDDEYEEWIDHVSVANDGQAVLACEADMIDIHGAQRLGPNDLSDDHADEEDWSYETFPADAIEANLAALEAALPQAQNYELADTFVEPMLARAEYEQR